MPPRVRTATEELDEALFEERAENLSSEQFSDWTHVGDFERKILGQLTNHSPRLLSGPRGCGKSTLLILAESRIQQRERDLAIYVNYGKSMFIEPAFTRRADAEGFFQDWLVARILLRTEESLAETSSQLSDLAVDCREFVESAETDPSTPRLRLPGPVQLSRLLANWTKENSKTKTILLLDDAAHAFVPEQQRIFFEFLTNLRSPDVTYKAAIYPGLTEFSPKFHVGHDAKIVNAWLGADGEQYREFMRQLFERRLPPSVRKVFPAELVDLFGGASFGVPRTFFSMLEAYLSNPPTNPGRITSRANAVIAEHAQQLRGLYRTMAQKLPAYKRFVETGGLVESHIVGELRELNKSRFERSAGQALDVAVRHPIDRKLITVFSLLEYAGIIRQTNESFSDGKDGRVYTRYSVHRSVLLEGNALTYGKNPTLSQRADSLFGGTRASLYKKVGIDAIFPAELAAKCSLDMGACTNCGEPRASQDARFCPKCGQELVNESLLTRLLRTKIDELPLTKKKIAALEDQGFETIEDVLRDQGNEGLRQAQGVGKVWSRRIRNIAEEYVNV